MTRVGPITITYFKQRYNKWALVIKVVENDASCGTSWILSRARTWSSVSMDGDNPPWRQNIYKQVKPTSDEDKNNWNITTATVHLHRTDHTAALYQLINKHIWWRCSLQCRHCRLKWSIVTCLTVTQEILELNNTTGSLCVLLLAYRTGPHKTGTNYTTSQTRSGTFFARLFDLY